MNQNAHASEIETQSKTNAVKETHHAEIRKPFGYVKAEKL